MHGQAREPRQDRKVATVTTFSQCRGVPGHLLFSMRWKFQNAFGAGGEAGAGIGTIPNLASTLAPTTGRRGVGPLAGRVCAAVCVVLLLSVSGMRAAVGPFPHERMGVANGCFVESVAFGDDLREREGEGVWYRLLQWG